MRAIRASTKGRNLAFVPVRRFLKPVFIRVHFVLRPVWSYILAILWYFLGLNQDQTQSEPCLKLKKVFYACSFFQFVITLVNTLCKEWKVWIRGGVRKVMALICRTCKQVMCVVKFCLFDQHWLIQVLWRGAKIRLEIPNILLPDLQQRVKTTTYLGILCYKQLSIFFLFRDYIITFSFDD